MPAKKRKSRSTTKRSSASRAKRKSNVSRRQKGLAGTLIHHRIKVYFASLALLVLFTAGLAIDSFAGTPVWGDVPPPPNASSVSVSNESGGTRSVSVTDKCKTILVIGDSIAHGMAADPLPTSDPNYFNGNKLKRQLSYYGYCATVHNRAIAGSAASEWTKSLPGLIALYKPDFIVAHFLGNQDRDAPPKWTDKGNAWWLANTGALKTINDQATAAGKRLYWVIPAPAQYYCSPTLYVTGLYRSFAKWQQNNLPKANQIDYRATWGGDNYISKFRTAKGIILPVRTDKIGIYKDCRHFTDLGYNYMANMVRYKTYGEWLN